MILLVVPRYPAKTASEDISRDEAITVHCSHTGRAETQGPYPHFSNRLDKRQPLGRFTPVSAQQPEEPPPDRAQSSMDKNVVWQPN